MMILNILDVREAVEIMIFYQLNVPFEFYQSDQSQVFANVLAFVQRHPNRCRMKEASNKLTLSFEQIKTVKKVSQVLKLMCNQG